MKARVKATGEIVEILGVDYIASNGAIYEEKSLYIAKDEPDYWDKLYHQATIDFMKSFLDNYDGTVNIESLLSNAIKLAKSLVNKLKEDSQCEK